MKNILNKLGKSLLIPALAFSLGTKQVNAQKLEFNPGVYGGAGTTHYSKFEIYPNWQSHFKKLNGNEELKHKKIKAYGDFQIGTDLGISFNEFSFGLNARYSISEVFKEKSLSVIELHNWKFDYARIYEATLKQKYPSLGFYIKFPVGKETKMLLRGSARKAEINEIKREDVSLSPADAKCDPVPIDETSNLTREFERIKSKTLLNKIGLEFQTRDEDEALWGWELYYESDWKRVHELGANVSVYFNLPEKKKD
jgi:hypothetical protein